MDTLNLPHGFPSPGWKSPSANFTYTNLMDGAHKYARDMSQIIISIWPFLAPTAEELNTDDVMGLKHGGGEATA